MKREREREERGGPEGGHYRGQKRERWKNVYPHRRTHALHAKFFAFLITLILMFE